MKYSVGDRVKNVNSGSVGTIQDSHYKLEIKSGIQWEEIRYFIEWDFKAKNSLWVTEDDLMPLEQQHDTNNEVSIGLLRMQIDKCLDESDKEGFLHYTNELNKLLSKVDDNEEKANNRHSKLFKW